MLLLLCTCACLPMQEKNIKHTGNITMDDIIEVARVMRPRSCAKSLAGTCKEMLGTAQSVGCTIDHMHPQTVMAKVRRQWQGRRQGDRSVEATRGAAAAAVAAGLWLCAHVFTSFFLAASSRGLLRTPLIRAALHIVGGRGGMTQWWGNVFSKRFPCLCEQRETGNMRD